MKVLMVVTYPEFGGTETHVLHLRRALQRRGVQVGVATMGGPFVHCFVRDHARVHRLPADAVARSAEGVLANAVRAIVGRHHYDVVHVHDSESYRMLRKLRTLCPTLPLVLTLHGKYVSAHEVRRAAAAADLAIAVSPAVRQWARRSGVDDRQIVWIPNGIDTREFSAATMRHHRAGLQLPSGARIGLYVGRFQVDKWRIADACIVASEQIAKRRPDFHFLLIGYGTYRRQLLRRARAVNRRVGREAIHVHAARPDLARVYAIATFVIGTGRVALEAMSCGKPVIAVGHAGYGGIVSDRTFARMVRTNFADHAASSPLSLSRLSNDMEVLLSNPPLAASLGAAGRRRVTARFSARMSADRTLRQYRRLLSR